MSTSEHDIYLQNFYSSLQPDQVSKILEVRSTPCTETLASFHTIREQRTFRLEELTQVQDLSDTEGVVVVIENIDQSWIAKLGVAWNIHHSFFARHACNPEVASTIWQAIFGNTVAEQKSPSAEVTSTHSRWHVDGFYGHNSYSPLFADSLSNTNWIPRLLRWDKKYGWQASTRISCYARHDLPQPLCEWGYKALLVSYWYGLAKSPSTDLFLIDSPLSRARAGAGGKQAVMSLHLPLAHNRGGLVIPSLHETGDHSLHDSLKRFLSHAWHFDVLFANERCLPPRTLFHLLASSLFEDNLRFIDGQIRDISFNKIRRPSIKINDSLHDLREALVSLQDQVTRTIKWMPTSVQQDLKSIQSKLKVTDRWEKSEAQPYVSFPSETLPDILERCNHLEDFLMQSFQLLISSTSVMNAESEKEQSSRNQSLTRLAFVYVPLSFVTGVFGMNVKEINGSPLSVWMVVVTLAVTIVCTAAIFVVIRVWKKYSDEHKDES